MIDMKIILDRFRIFPIEFVNFVLKHLSYCRNGFSFFKMRELKLLNKFKQFINLSTLDGIRPGFCKYYHESPPFVLSETTFTSFRITAVSKMKTWLSLYLL